MPGLVYPADAPRTRASAAEVKFYDALRAQLPDGWTAWHSLRLRTADRYEGEGDFVIAAPDRGLLVLEVKGGRMELAGGHWLQNGRVLDKAPRQQALGVVHAIVAHLRAQQLETPAFGVAAAFPDTEFTTPPTGSDVAGLVLGQRDLAWLARVLPELMSRALPDRAPCATTRWIKAIHALWGETWVPTVSLRDAADDATRRLIELDDAQRTVLDLAGDNPSALVEGGAGNDLADRRAKTGASCRTEKECLDHPTNRLILDAVETLLGEGKPFAREDVQEALDVVASNSDPGLLPVLGTRHEFEREL